MSGISFTQHSEHLEFETRDDCLCIGGRTVLELAREVGRTPFYAYDRSSIARRVRKLRETLPEDVKLHYAMKANPLPTIVAQLAKVMDGIDVASVGELRVALAAGANPREISFAGPGKTDAELEEAALAGIVINVESERELRVLEKVAHARGVRPRVAIRVNPDFELKTSGMKMGGGPKQFGIDAERVPEVLASLRGKPFEFTGFHIFGGSQNLRPEAIVEAQTKAISLAIELVRHAPTPPTLLNIGGGFGIPYFPGERPLDLAPIAANLRDQLPRVREHFPQAELVLELGRYLVGEAGVYICRVLDRKISRGQVFLVTDGGLHHHLSASGNFGQVIRKNYPVLIANKVRGTERETSSVVGPLCTPLDLLADRMDLARAEEGDLVAVLQSGAYGLTASPLGFLSHPAPGEIVV